MLAIQRQNKYFSKVMTLPNGTKALVYFELIERNGHVIAKAIRAEAINSDIFSEEKIYALPCIKSPISFIPVKSIFSDLLSIFSKDFSFMSCHITRAPNFC